MDGGWARRIRLAPMPVRFRPNVAEMAGYVPGEQPPAGTRLIKLNTNESPYPPSPHVAEAVRAELRELLGELADRRRRPTIGLDGPSTTPCRPTFTAT